MRLERLVHRLSLTTRLIGSYLIILAIGGLVTSIVGSWIVSTTIMRQAQRTAEHDLATARTIFDERRSAIQRTVRLVSYAGGLGACVGGDGCGGARSTLDAVREESVLDFLSLADARGIVRLRTTSDTVGDDVGALPLIRTALRGSASASPELLDASRLERETPSLADRVRLRPVVTARARPATDTTLTTGLVLLAAAPVRGPDGAVTGVLYGGVVLNGQTAMVDRVWELLYRGETHRGRDIGTVTIFQGDVRIATNVRLADGRRAIGTRVSDEVRSAVLEGGRRWSDRAFVVNDWYRSVYEPIRDSQDRIIGMLYVGVLESRFTSIRNRVILSFFGIATIGFILILAITYVMIRTITRPIEELVAATRRVAAGDLDREVGPAAPGEIALLAESFNTMQASLRHMKTDLEEWGRTLEEKVRERTDELGRMQVRMAQSERLASLGMLAAGVAHEINNPLGGILALTSLVVEDLRPDDPARRNLEEVVRQAQRCGGIVRGLLEFSRQSKAEMEMLRIEQVLDNTLDLVGKQASFFNVRVEKDIEPDLPPIVADRAQLSQVFLNLIMNAVQAMDEHGTLTVVIRSADAREAVEVAIGDTGRGIPAEDLDRVFDPFFTTKTDGQGTGLGLSIAYGIVTRHRGTITAESAVGRGTTFRIRLPVGASAPAEPVA